MQDKNRSNQGQESADFMDIQQIIEGYKAEQKHKISQILNCINSSSFCARYACLENNEPDVFTLINTSSSRIYFEVFANIQADQVQKLRSYEFSSHPFFEETVTLYTKTKEKPNLVLMRTRPWDVAYNMILKVEALREREQKQATNILLRREYHILKLLWNFFLKEGFDLEEMLGIPMVFDYKDVPNDVYNFKEPQNTKEIDIYGHIIPLASPADSRTSKVSSLCYLTLEKLGPSVAYLMRLYGAAYSTPPVFTFETAFKIFDQLICRLIQIHRAGVVHYDISPEHIHFGRARGVNLVYLSHFKSAVYLDAASERNRMGKYIGNERFGSLSAVKLITIHPFQDIESAFYFLLGMLNANLPWDFARDNIKAQFYKTFSMARSSFLMQGNNAVGGLDRQDQQDDPEVIHKIRETKAAFWKSPQYMKKLLHSMDYERVESNYCRQLAMEILYELYLKIKEVINEYGHGLNPAAFCKSIKFTTSKEHNLYSDIRRCVLIYFRFEKHSDVLAGLNFRTKEENMVRQPDLRNAWDLSIWCFSNIEVNASKSKPESRIRESILTV